MERIHINAHRWPWCAALTVGIVAVLGVATPSAVIADPGPGKAAGGASAALPAGAAPAGFPSWAALIRAQNRLIAIAERIKTAPGARDGYAGLVLRPEQRRLTVYWKGAMPTPTRRLVNAARLRAGIEVLPATYSAAELAAAARSFAGRPGVATAGGNVDGSGLTVTVTDAGAGRVAATAAGGVPVTVKAGARPVAAACTGRQDDCTPYFGGAMYNNACSTGFTVRHLDVNKIISAAHCADDGDVINDGGGENIGTVEGDDNANDTLLIAHPAGVTSTRRIYAGPFDAGVTSSRLVTDVAVSSFVGAIVCTSGSFTGEHCALRVSAVGLTLNTDAGVMFNEVAADEIDGGTAVGKGDSGGPVHFLGADGSATATGTISALSNVVGCPVGSPSPLCGSTVFYADVRLALSRYGAAMVTG